MKKTIIMTGGYFKLRTKAAVAWRQIKLPDGRVIEHVLHATKGWRSR